MVTEALLPASAKPAGDSGPYEERSTAGASHESTQPIFTILGSAIGPINKKSNKACRFYATKTGCRAGAQCRFQHPENTNTNSSAQGVPVLTVSERESDPSKVIDVTATQITRALLNRSRRPEPKPKPAAEIQNPREFQITQVVRRYSPFRADIDGTTQLKFRLKPTDPDFAFDLEELHCCLKVPPDYPSNGRPMLEVQNTDMPRSFQINVERGFEELSNSHIQKSLLALLNDLDKHLERFLSAPGAMTFKIVANKATSSDSEKSIKTSARHDFDASTLYEPNYKTEDLNTAKKRRDLEIRQLDARLGRSEHYSKAADGVAFMVPLRPLTQHMMAESLRKVHQAALIVPEVYPLEPCTIILMGTYGTEAENVEVNFEKHAVKKSQLSLMAHINYLSQNLVELSIGQQKAPGGNAESPPPQEDATLDGTKHEELMLDPERPHLRYTARPPEWDVHLALNSAVDVSDSETDDGLTEQEEDSGQDSDLDRTAGGAPLPFAGPAGKEQGTQISFPNLSLVGIELLQVAKLSVVAKCDRCKSSINVQGLAPAVNPDHDATRTEICQKCSAIVQLGYRTDLMHIASTKAGYVDTQGCALLQLLPSVFQPTCSNCSTVSSTPETVAIPGDTKTVNCRSCHGKMTFCIPEVKFLRLSNAAMANFLPPRAHKAREKLDTNAGSPLPDHGKCQHYNKSYRWFRFSCCMRVFPCDKCHDSRVLNPSQKDNPHPNEHAERMICGYCSREQRYHPDTCRHCGHSVIKKSVTSGYWEGGKGTRERHLMRRNEKHKYKTTGTEKKELNKRRVESKGKGGMWWPD